MLLLLNADKVDSILLASKNKNYTWAIVTSDQGTGFTSSGPEIISSSAECRYLFYLKEKERGKRTPVEA